MKKKAARPVVVIPGGRNVPVPARKAPKAHPKAPVVIPGGPNVPVPARKPVAKKKPVKRKLALGEAVACCAAEALAASLRLAGWPVSDEDVLALYERTADGPDTGATLSATLEAASVFGLAGVKPLNFSPATINRGFLSLILGVDLPGSHAVCLGPDGAWWSWGEPYDPADFPDAVIEEAWVVTWLS